MPGNREREGCVQRVRELCALLGLADDYWGLPKGHCAVASQTLTHLAERSGARARAVDDAGDGASGLLLGQTEFDGLLRQFRRDEYNRRLGR